MLPSVIGLILGIVYVGGLWKFWQGFRYTQFNNTLPNRFVLSLFWPALLVVSKSYRQNFNRALKG
jgi:hypothetical protein